MRGLLLLWTRSSRIQTSRRRSVSRSRQPRKEGPFLRGRQIAFMIYDYFRVTGAHGTVLDFADLPSVTLRDDNVQEYDSRWDEILLSVSEIPSDDILESLYTLRIRESDQLKTALELCEMEFHQKILELRLQMLTPDTGKSKQEQWSRVGTWHIVEARFEHHLSVRRRQASVVWTQTSRSRFQCRRWVSAGCDGSGAGTTKCTFTHRLRLVLLLFILDMVVGSFDASLVPATRLADRVVFLLLIFFCAKDFSCEPLSLCDETAVLLFMIGFDSAQAM